MGEDFFRNIPEFRILRLTFKYWISQIIIDFLFLFSVNWPFQLEIAIKYFVGILQVLKFADFLLNFKTFTHDYQDKAQCLQKALLAWQIQKKKTTCSAKKCSFVTMLQRHLRLNYL